MGCQKQGNMLAAASARPTIPVMRITSSSVYGRPVALSPSVEAQVYALFAVAMGLTAAGVFLGAMYAQVLLGGMLPVLMLLELGLIFTSGWWSRSSPLNVVLFGLFPLLSGITITPYLMMVVAGYTNGASILLNAVASTACMALAAAVFARTTSWDLSFLGRAMLFGILGLVLLGVLQLFVPSLQTGAFELFLSGAGVLFFAVFTAYDIQRIQTLSRMGMSPILLALSLYLDIFNLFLYVVRFMVALSGDRR